ncbi:MAG: hypothetical protein LBE36_03375 [Flavobacteriaceae bacterium]|jgi:hypothetical protein|nr:hypothetical protein [Flavobacteriaceae bacterium]
MSTLKLILTVSAIGSMMFGCGENSSKTSHLKEEKIEHKHHHEDENSAENIELNGVEKWLVNDEMKPFVSESETALERYISGASSDYKTLAKTLEEKNSELIKSCTMKGKSHDELHKWLQQHLELIEKLNKAETKENADEWVSELKTSFQTYHRYFR